MYSWTLALRGILAFLLGMILIIWPGGTLDVLLVLFPIFVIIDGGGAIIIGSKTAGEGRWLSFIPMGVLEIMLGVIVFAWPSITITVFVLLMALWAFVLGLGEFFLAIADRKLSVPVQWLYVAGGVFTTVLGVLMLIYPLSTSLAVIWLIGLFFLVYGILLFTAGIWASAHYKKIKE